MSELGGGDVRELWQAMLQQQAAMLEVQAESLRLQRLLIERILGASSGGQRAVESQRFAETPPPVGDTVQSTNPPPTAETTTSPVFPVSDVAMEVPTATELILEADNEITPEPDKLRPSLPGVNQTRAARYYQSRPSPGLPSVTPEELELMRRLQEMRESSSLILQFGPFKGTTLAQVAMHNPEYIRQLVLSAQRSEVRAAAGRLVEALDAAADHKRRTSRPSRRGRSTA